MNRANLAHFPRMNKTIVSRHTRGSKQGRGIGAVILDGGMGGQSSYSSIDNYLATTSAPPPIGSGLKGLDKIRSQMENLIIKPSVKKPKNIKFSI
jgi:hypothetical protein